VALLPVSVIQHIVGILGAFSCNVTQFCSVRSCSTNQATYVPLRTYQYSKQLLVALFMLTMSDTASIKVSCEVLISLSFYCFIDVAVQCNVGPHIIIVHIDQDVVTL